MSFRVLVSLIIFCLFSSSTVNSYALPYQEENTTKKQQEPEQKDTTKAEDKPGDTTKIVIKKRPEILAPINSLQQQEQDLTHYLTADEITPMLAGAQDFITLINENTASNQKGVMILLPDWGMTAISSNALNYLQTILPTQGWTTITIQPPSRPLGYPSRALKLSMQLEEDDKTLLAHQEYLTAMMTAVMNKAKDYPGIFVVVSQGSHAILLANLYSTGKLKSPSAMVMLSGYMNTAAESLSFAKILASSEFPVLDIYLSKEQQLATSAALIRKAQATKEMKVYYRQTQLHNNQIGYYPEKALLRSINGWLKSIGW
ncbi:DUF3530 family protein [Colwellia hornerae]|uniref:DUF3530 family protein n=1 Tax=Colwellia hornerae TaxID=89402 RepID=A0A5C6QBK2_9GAMM|nr:DUF3530 family protein [Colwellia hornerae]TWX53029.1 DUF3530 family protein [Colwellia hornerae]TWX59292.1 DUF3530 family protein [Colwellia hornerae]TWX66178.1 DUF3530 family protein [Colwellia hornerae]